MKGDLQPDTLAYEHAVFDFAFHPSEDIVATALITGHINCVKYAPGAGNNETVWNVRPSKKSCRGLAFSHDGAALFTISKDGTLGALDTATGNVLIKKPEAHEHPINRVRLLTEQMLATGDDGGTIKLWDVRTGNETMSYSEHSDFISDFDFHEPSKTLVASSGQGTISVYDIRKPKMVAMSDNQDDELMSICIIKDRRKVLAGSQEGVLNIYSWNDWGDCTDRFTGHPNSIDTICKIDENTVATGSSDGIIRVIEILPNKFRGVIGEHGEFPIEHIRLSHDQTYLASCSHDDTVRFWDIRYLNGKGSDEDEDEDEDDEDDDEDIVVPTKSGNGKSDDEDSDDDSDDDSQDDSNEDEDEDVEEDDGDDSASEGEAKAQPKKTSAPAKLKKPVESGKEAKRAKESDESDDSNDSDDSDDSDDEPRKKKAKRQPEIKIQSTLRVKKKAAGPVSTPGFFDDL